MKTTQNVIELDQPTAHFMTWAPLGLSLLSRLFSLLQSHCPSFSSSQRGLLLFLSQGFGIHCLLCLAYFPPFLSPSLSHLNICVWVSVIFFVLLIWVSIWYNFSSVLRTLFNIVVKISCQQGLLAFACLKMSVFCLHFLKCIFAG